MVKLVGIRPKTRIGALLILALAPSADSLRAQVIPYDATIVSDAAQDGSGKVWAITGQPYGTLSAWGKNKWEAASIPAEVIGATPYGLGLGTDGSVLCAWQSASAGINILTRHRGSQSSIMAHFRTPALSPQIQLLSDAKSNIWITHQGRVYRIYPESEKQISYSIARRKSPRKCRGRTRPASGTRAACPVQSSREGRRKDALVD